MKFCSTNQNDRSLNGYADALLEQMPGKASASSAQT